MNKRIPAAFLPAVLALALCAGCHNTEPQPSETTQPTAKATTPPSPTAPTEMPAPPATPTPLKDALTTMLAKEAESPDSPFPKGTRLKDVELKDKVASIDLSEEFNDILSKGESTEGAAQKLCATLAQFSNVEKMRLTVEGKSFDSQATDWNTPFPVRPQTDSADQTDGTHGKQGGGQ